MDRKLISAYDSAEARKRRSQYPKELANLRTGSGEKRLGPVCHLLLARK
jgi:hypothetical protein